MKFEHRIPPYLASVFAQPWVTNDTRIHLLYDFLEETKSEVLFSLDYSAYRSDKCRGEIDSDSFRITEIEDDGICFKDTLKGEVYVEFEEYAHYGCRDMNNSHDHQVGIPFKILPDSELIEFTVLEEFERYDEI